MIEGSIQPFLFAVGYGRITFSTTTSRREYGPDQSTCDTVPRQRDDLALSLIGSSSSSASRHDGRCLSDPQNYRDLGLLNRVAVESVT